MGNMYARETDLRLGLTCPTCRETLTFITSAELLFCCPQGHTFLPDQLLAEQSQAGKRALGVVVMNWEQRIEVLKNIAVRALGDGHPDVADIFHRKAGSLEKRLLILREAILKDESDVQQASPRPPPPPA